MATLSSVLAWRIPQTEEVQSMGSKRAGQTEWLTLSDGPVVRTLRSNAEGVSPVPCWGAKIPHGSWPEIPCYLRLQKGRNGDNNNHQNPDETGVQ